jgi:hypothetical protein
MTYWWRHSYWNWAIECEDVSNIILSGRLTSSFVGHQKTFRIAFRCQRMLRCSKNEKKNKKFAHHLRVSKVTCFSPH